MSKEKEYYLHFALLPLGNSISKTNYKHEVT